MWEVWASARDMIKYTGWDYTDGTNGTRREIDIISGSVRVNLKKRENTRTSKTSEQMNEQKLLDEAKQKVTTDLRPRVIYRFSYVCSPPRRSSDRGGLGAGRWRESRETNQRKKI